MLQFRKDNVFINCKIMENDDDCSARSDLLSVVASSLRIFGLEK